MTFLLAFATVSFASIAQAAITYDFRFDMQSKNYDEGSNALGYEDFRRFYLSRGRIDFQGSFNEVTAYRLRLRFNEPMAGKVDAGTQSPTVNDRDSLGRWVDHASVTHRVHPIATLTLGKFASDIGGYEAAAIADRYSISPAYAPSATGSFTASEPFQFYTGVKIAIGVPEQELALHVANAEPSDRRTGVNFSQNDFATGVVYKGNFGMFAPIWAFHEFPATGTNEKIRFQSLGNRFQAGDIQLDLDWLKNVHQNASAPYPAETLTEAITTSLGYKLGSLTTKAQYHQASSIATGSPLNTVSRQTSMGLAFEITPDLKDRFRFHFAMIETKANVDGLIGERKISEWIFGARLVGDFLRNN